MKRYACDVSSVKRYACDVTHSGRSFKNTTIIWFQGQSLVEYLMLLPSMMIPPPEPLPVGSFYSGNVLFTTQS